MDYFFVLSGYLITTLLLVEYTRTEGQTGEGWSPSVASGSAESGDSCRRCSSCSPGRSWSPACSVAGRSGRPSEAMASPRSSTTPTGTSSGAPPPTGPRSSIRRCATPGRWRSRSSSTWSGRSLFLGLARVHQARPPEVLSRIMGGLLLLSAWWMRQKALGSSTCPAAYFGTDTRAQGLIAGVMLAFFLWQDRFDDEKWVRRANWIGTGLVRRAHRHDVPVRRAGPGGLHELRLPARGGASAPCSSSPAPGPPSGPLEWIFGNRGVDPLRDISYPFYLWHWPVIVFVEPCRPKAGTRRSWKLLAMLLTLVLTELTYWYVEKPDPHAAVRLPRPSLVLSGAASPPRCGPAARHQRVDPRRAQATDGGHRDRDLRRAPVGHPGPRRRRFAGLARRRRSAQGPGQYKVKAMFQAHCDIIGTASSSARTVEIADPNCPTWPQRWAGRGQARDPDAVVMLTGLRQLFDLDIDGTGWSSARRSGRALPGRSVEGALSILAESRATSRCSCSTSPAIAGRTGHRGRGARRPAAEDREPRA